MSKLPKGWIKVRIPEVCELNPPKPGANDVQAETQVTFVPMAAVNAQTGSIESPTIRPFREVSKGFTSFREEDVIMAKITPCMENGKAAIARGLCNGLGFGSTEFHVFRSTQAILPEFVFYFIRQESFRKRGEANMTGSVGQKRVPSSFLAEFDIPLPPLNEQRRIVEKLEKLLDKVDACQKRLEKIPLILKRFRQSVLAAACSGKLTADWREKLSQIESPDSFIKRIRKYRIDKHESDCMKAISSGLRKPRRPTNLEPKIRFNDAIEEIPTTWFWASFEDIASTETYSMSSGPFGSALGRKDYVDAGIPVIRGQNIQSGRFVLNGFVYVSNEKALELKRSIAYPKDIIVVAVGSSGQAAMVPLPEYVNLSLQVQISQDRLREKTTDTARPFLSLTNLKTLLLPIPPIDEQQEIVRQVESLFKLADQVEARYNKARAYVDKLAQSILAKAFRGELVPQDPDDEPASALLERIREQRATTQPTNKKARPASMKKKQAGLFDQA
jgi:type I restriction enzyme S subunit